MSVSGILFILELILLAKFSSGSPTYGQIKPSDYGNNGYSKRINYIFHTAGLTWNEARQVCIRNGGTLAKIESLKLHEAIYAVAKSIYGTDIFADYDYYLSIIWIGPGQYIWTSDCTWLQETDRYASTHENKCIRIKKDTLTPEYHNCHDARAFLCQQESDDECEENMILDGSYQYIPDTNASICAWLCLQDVRCWSYIRYPIGMCVKIMFSGYGIDGFQMAVKQCINVTKNDTIPTENVDYVANDSDTAYHNCTEIFNASAVTVAPPSSAFPLPLPCYPQEQTQNVTVSVPVTVESILIQPTTVTVQSIVVVPTTTTDISVQIQHVSVTVTETISFNVTYNLTNDQFAEAESKAAEIVKNLTINTKTTSSYVRKLSCAEDKRTSASFVGYVGVIFVVLPIGLMVLIDIRKLVLDFINPRNMYGR